MNYNIMSGSAALSTLHSLQATLHIKLNSIIYIFIAIPCTIVYRTETRITKPATKATCSLPLSCIALIPLQPVYHHSWFSSRESLLLPSEQSVLIGILSGFFNCVFPNYSSFQMQSQWVLLLGQFCHYLPIVANLGAWKKPIKIVLARSP